MKNIAIFTGNRSEYGLLEPLIEALDADSEFEISLLISGSHLSVQFGNTAKYIPDKYNGYIIPILVDFDNNIGVTQSMGLGLIQFPGTLANIRPDCLIVLGDRYETLAVSIAAYNLGIPIAHIQGDDVTLGSLDDGYRRCIRELASIHFTVEEYGSLGCVFPDYLQDEFPFVDALISYHPIPSRDGHGVLRNIVKAIGTQDYLLINSNCDSGGRKLNNIYNGCNLSRNSYLSYLKQAKVIIGNSSSGLIEAPSLGTPTINIGDRQMGRRRATSVIDCDGTVESIKLAIAEAKQIKFPVENPYYKEGTIENIINKLKTF